MQVKKFEAPTMQEALKVIKRELGPEAVILQTKHIKSGFGLMSKASVEVTAAVAEKDLKKKKAAERGLPEEVKEKIWNKPAERQAEVYDNYFERQLRQAGKSDKVELSKKAPAAPSRQPQPPRQIAVPAANSAPAISVAASASAQASQVTGKSPETRRYIDIADEEPQASRGFFGIGGGSAKESVRSAPSVNQAGMQTGAPKVETLEREIENLRGVIDELTTSKSSGVQQASEGVTDEMQQAMQDLIASGVEKRFARQLVKQISFEMGEDDRNDETAIQEHLAAQMMREVEVKDILDGVGASSGNSTTTVLALVGPTGVGKTTTIAKIASLGILDRKLRVGLINLDSYKVAAADQLATYARIMGVPFRSVNTKEELDQALHDFASLDLVLLDTTGRSQKDQESLLQLRHTLNGIENLRTALLVSATTKDTDLNEVTSRFRIFHPQGLVISKLDETGVYGCIYNLQKRTNLPLLYFTVGQRVPEDIERASPERVVDLVLDL